MIVHAEESDAEHGFTENPLHGPASDESGRMGIAICYALETIEG
jgi:hypothetical protein